MQNRILLMMLCALTALTASAVEMPLNLGAREEKTLYDGVFWGRGDKVLLKLRACKPLAGVADKGAAAGYIPGIRIYVNQTPLTAEQLVNRPAEFKTARGQTVSSVNAAGVWTLPCRGEAFPAEPFAEEEFVFDITPLLASAGTLQVRVRNQSPAKYPEAMIREFSLSGLDDSKVEPVRILEKTLSAQETAEGSITVDGAAGKTNLLMVKCRAESPKFNKLVHLLKIKVNGEVLRPLMPPSQRVLNRSLLLPAVNAELPVRHGDPATALIPLFREKIGGGSKMEAERGPECKEGMWLARFSPDWEVRPRDYRTGGQDFLYLFDLSDLLKEGKNRISFQNGALESENSPKLHVLADSVTLDRPSPLSAERKESGAGMKPGEVTFRMAPGSQTIDWLYQGQVFLQSTVELEARRFDTPAKPEPATLQRTVEYLPAGYFQVHDRIANPHDFPVLVRTGNRNVFVHPLEELRVAGLDYPNSLLYQKTLESPDWKNKVLWRRFNANPTAFAGFGERQGGAGFVLADAVSRNHHTFDRVDPEQRLIGWETGYLKLAPKGTVTLSWQFHPAAEGDYFDFANAVRERLDLNRVTVAENFCFAGVSDLNSKSVEEIRKMLAHHRAGAVITWGGYVWPDPEQAKPPYDIIFGAPVMNAPYKDYLKELAAAGKKLKEADPKVKFIPYFHLTLAGPLTKDEVELYHPEICIQRDGSPAARTWGVKEKNRRFRPETASYSMLPQEDGPYGKAIRRTIDYYVGQIGADGFFLDEYGGHFYDNRGESDYYELDRQGQLFPVRTVGDHANPFVRQVMQECHRKGLKFWGNGSNLNLYLDGVDFCPVFSEARLNLYQPAETVHLATPIALWYRPVVATVRMVLNEGLMPGGTSLNWPHNFTANLYPFTPLKIGQGFVIGREALISAVPLPAPSDFGGPELTRYEYGADGKEQISRVRYPAGERIPVPADGFIILRK
jgi:hypothetical protein